MSKKACYAREGNVVYRFDRKPIRDAWVAQAPKVRRAVLADDLPLRLKTGRSVEGLELRDGHNGMPTPLVIRRPRKPIPKR